MKLTAKQIAAFRQVAAGHIKLYRTPGMDQRVLDAIGEYGCRYNLQVDILVRRGYVVRDEIMDGAPWTTLSLTLRGEKALAQL